MNKMYFIGGKKEMAIQDRYKVVCTLNNWTLEVRPRNNHSGSKIWGLAHGREIFSYDERGFRVRDGGRVPVPSEIIDKAAEIWKTMEGKISIQA